MKFAMARKFHRVPQHTKNMTKVRFAQNRVKFAQDLVKSLSYDSAFTR